MGRWDDQKIEEFRHRMENVTEEQLDRYRAEREESERLAKVRQRRREHFAHQLGLRMIWLAGFVFSFDIGHSYHRFVSPSYVAVTGAIVSGLLFGGLALFSMNQHRRDWPDDND